MRIEFRAGQLIRHVVVHRNEHLARLRGLGYTVTWNRGYEVQERFGFEGGGGTRSLAAVYEQQLQLLRSELTAMAGQVEAEVEAEAPAAVASLFAGAIARQLGSRR